MTETTTQTQPEDILVHICEACGVTKTISSKEAYDEGWDYPPFMGAFGVISPRTCGDCGIEKTLWWRLAVEKIDPATLTEADTVLITRITEEPGSILPEVPDGE